MMKCPILTPWHVHRNKSSIRMCVFVISIGIIIQIPLAQLQNKYDSTTCLTVEL